MIHHFVVGDMAAQPLLDAISEEDSMQGDVTVLKDILHVGPLKRAENQSFSQLRTDFWTSVINDEKQEVQVDDQERVLEIVNKLHQNPDDVVWLWMAPWPADVCAYYWLLKHLQQHLDRYFVLNIAGLPFLDQEGKVYYPKNISEILPKELIKARKLAREVTPAELEVDGEEWDNLVEENAAMRLLEGGKKLFTKEASHFDEKLLSFCSHQFTKAHRIVNQAMKKLNIPTGDLYLGWRLRQLIEQEVLICEGDPNKTLKDYSIKLPGGATEATEPAQTENEEES